MKLILITGTTKGLGLELLKTALKAQDHVVSIARRPQANQAGQWHIVADLKGGFEYLDQVADQFKKLDLQTYSQVVLVNNAAVVEPIGPSDSLPTKDLIDSMTVNLQTSMVLTQKFLSLVKEFGKKIIIVNISSGAGYRPIPGWSAYCTAKAGLNMYTQCLASEYKADPKYHFYNFSPGIMNTEMQGQIRSKDQKQFSLVHNFIQYYKTGRLRDPKIVAEKLYGLIDKAENFSKVDYDIEEFL